MAKKQNHYIPRMLLARFASRRDRDKAWIWQLRPGREPKEVSVRDVGVATYFYGKPETGVEEQFFKQETHTASILDAIEAGENPANYDVDLRHWVHTLAYRTRHIRDAFAEGADDLLNEMASSADSDRAQRARQAYLDANLDRILLNVLSNLPRDQRNNILAALKKAPDGWHNLRVYAMQYVSQVDLGKETKELLLKIRPFAETEKAAKKGQIGGLSRILNAEPHETPITIDTWHVVRADPSLFILGDCCVFCVDEHSAAYPLPAAPKSFKELYLPLSQHCVVVGLRGSSQPMLPTEQINLSAAKVSRDMLFAARLDASTQGLSKVIGTSSSYFRGDSVHEMVQSVWEEICRNPEDRKNNRKT
jgi:hypothetical protein